MLSGESGIHLRAVVEDVLDAQAARADVLARIFLGNRLVLDLALGQIDPGHLVGVSAEFHVNLLLGGEWVFSRARRARLENKEAAMFQLHSGLCHFAGFRGY